MAQNLRNSYFSVTLKCVALGTAGETQFRLMIFFSNIGLNYAAIHSKTFGSVPALLQVDLVQYSKTLRQPLEASSTTVLTDWVTLNVPDLQAVIKAMRQAENHHA